MNLFQENNWVCGDCGLEYQEYGPQYECPACGSNDIDLAEEDE